MIRLGLCLMLLVLAGGGALPARGAERALPEGGVPALAPDAFLNAYRVPATGERGTTAVVAADAPGAAQAVRVATTGPVENPWSFQIQVANSAPIRKGDALYIEAWFRAVEPSAETGEAASGVVFENGKTFDKSLDLSFSAARHWTHIYQAFESKEDYAPEAAHLIFRAGYPRQSFEVAAVRLLNFGTRVKVKDLPSMPFTYAGRAPDAAWRQAALARIDEIRKAALTVQVVDAAGQPVTGAQVHVAMTRHAFIFGTAVAADMLRADRSGPEVAQYRKILQENFNAATIENDLKWPGWVSQRAQGLEALHWLKEHGFTVRGHNLVWPSWQYMPRELREKYEHNLDPMRAITLDHIRDEVGATKGLVDRWDVVNEPIVNHVLMDKFGWGEMADWYKLVHQLDPHPVLCLNEYSILSAGGLDQAHQAALVKIVKDLQAAGAPLQALGLQGHMGMNATPPERVLQVLDRFAKLGLPMEITEFDIPGADEQLQADYTRDFLIATFSHPQVVGFTMWGFWEGRHWRGDSAMFRRDFSPKPSATVWHELVYKDWWTDQTVPTDAQGAAALRGFLGDYDVTVTRGGQTATATATLAKGGTRVQVVVK